MSYYYQIDKDSHGIPREDKERVMDQIRAGPKATKQVAFATGMDITYSKRVIKHLEGIGAVTKVGRDGASIIWGVKA